MTCAMVMYVCLGANAGYAAARIYKSFGGEKWKSNVLLTAMLSPGYVKTRVIDLVSLKMICRLCYFQKYYFECFCFLYVSKIFEKNDCNLFLESCSVYSS